MSECCFSSFFFSFFYPILKSQFFGIGDSALHILVLKYTLAVILFFHRVQF